MSRFLTQSAQSVAADMFVYAPDALVEWATARPRVAAKTAAAVMRSGRLRTSNANAIYIVISHAQRAMREGRALSNEPDAYFYTTHPETGEEGDGVWTAETFMAPTPPTDEDASQQLWRKVALVAMHPTTKPDDLLRWAGNYYRGSFERDGRRVDSWSWNRDPREELAEHAGKRAQWRKTREDREAQIERLKQTPSMQAYERRRDWFSLIDFDDFDRIVRAKKDVEEREARTSAFSTLAARVPEGKTLLYYPATRLGGRGAMPSMAEIRALQEERRRRPFEDVPVTIYPAVKRPTSEYVSDVQSAVGRIGSLDDVVARLEGSSVGGKLVVIDVAGWSASMPPLPVLQALAGNIEDLRYIDAKPIAKLLKLNRTYGRFWLHGSSSNLRAWDAAGQPVRKGTKTHRMLQSALYTDDVKRAADDFKTTWSAKDAPRED